jgi:hypothetical protein
MCSRAVRAKTLRSVGQLAPQPDLTRQCAFDLRSRLEILSAPPDGAGQSCNAVCTERGSRLHFGFLPIIGSAGRSDNGSFGLRSKAGNALEGGSSLAHGTAERSRPAGWQHGRRWPADARRHAERRRAPTQPRQRMRSAHRGAESGRDVHELLTSKRPAHRRPTRGARAQDEPRRSDHNRTQRDGRSHRRGGHEARRSTDPLPRPESVQRPRPDISRPRSLVEHGLHTRGELLPVLAAAG